MICPQCWHCGFLHSVSSWCNGIWMLGNFDDIESVAFVVGAWEDPTTLLGREGTLLCLAAGGFLPCVCNLTISRAELTCTAFIPLRVEEDGTANTTGFLSLDEAGLLVSLMICCKLCCFQWKSLISRQLSRKIFASNKIESEKRQFGKSHSLVQSPVSTSWYKQCYVRIKKTTNKSISLSNLVFNI